MSNFIEKKFSTRAKKALVTAQETGLKLSAQELGTGHLLFGLLFVKQSFASEVLKKHKLKPEKVFNLLKTLVHRNPPSAKSNLLPLTDRLQAALEAAVITASRHQYKFIGTEHLLYGILSTSGGFAENILTKNKISTEEIIKQLETVFQSAARSSENRESAEPVPDSTGADSGEEPFPLPGRDSYSALDHFTTDLTELAENNGLDPLIGREREVERLISILSRRTKNNPVLIGEPGVGKTALVEGLAQLIINQDVPETLTEKRILSLDLGQMVAGSMFRGEFEQRMKQLIDEVTESDDVILFIDEVHTIVGAGGTTGSLDAGNLLKPALARGDLRAIGATTLVEHKKHIEKDAALARRFQPLLIKESSETETKKILRGLSKNYESFHKVKISTKAINKAVELSQRFLPDRFLPDKAIDLIDETAAFYRAHSPEAKAVNKQFQQKKSKAKKLLSELKKLSKEKQQAIIKQDFTLAKKIQKQEQGLLKKHSKLKKKLTKSTKTLKLDPEQIAKTLSRMTGIPVEKVAEREAVNLLNLEKQLRKKVIGQNRALKQVSESIRRARAGLSAKHQPLGSFLFLGPSGVGKTHLAKVLAEEVFGGSENLIRIDMSEMTERHQASKLLGAPAGYVGYGEGGRLTEAVRRQPYSLVLLDEIEKAHPDTLNLLLQILEEGELTDGEGKTVNFRNTLIVLTSNLGAEQLKNLEKNFGFSNDQKTSHKKSERAQTTKSQHKLISREVKKAVRKKLRPELVNRIGDLVVFNHLNRADLEKIVRLELKDMRDRLKEKEISAVIDQKLIKRLAALSRSSNQGARLIKKNIRNHIENTVVENLLSGKINSGEKIKITTKTATDKKKGSKKKLTVIIDKK